MKIAFTVAVLAAVVVVAIYCYWFGLKDALNMYPRSKKAIHPEYRKGLLAELAAIDQQIANTEALTASECDDATLQRATELLAEAQQLREHVEGKLRAE